jgi:hypothetical protein
LSDQAKLIGAAVVSVVPLTAGFFVLLHHGYSDSLQKAATGWIGLVAGYWLK